MASFSTPSGLYCPTSRFLQMPLGLLVTEQSSRFTGFQAPGSQNGSLSPLSTSTFSLSSWQPTSGVPLWAFKRVHIRKFCCLVLQEPPAIMSLVRFLSLLTAQHSSSFTETPVRGKSRPVNPCLTFSFSTFAG